MSSKNFIRTAILPYAEALHDLTHTRLDNSLLTQDIESIYQILLQSKDLVNLLSNPLISTKSKKEIVINLFSGQIHDIIVNFVFVVIDRKRILFLREILELYFELNFASESIIFADIYSVEQLTLEQQHVLIEKLQNITNTMQVKLRIIIDSSLIGGLIIKIGSKVIDVSLRGQLQAMSSFLQAN